jgi:hypothetical protein
MCKDCESSYTYNMTCIKCCARHCKNIFYDDLTTRWEYVKQVAVKYNHNARDLAELVKGKS